MPQEGAGERREHFGRGQLVTEPAKSVFINCPYDPAFQPTFDAIVFAVVCCGFMPRSALESGTVAASRIERILTAMFSSKYSIHDLSRCRGEGDENLARFNMPLELGMAMARRFTKTRKGSRHDWLLLVPDNHWYARFASDLGGYDPVRYDGGPESVVPKVMLWLSTRPDAERMPTPHEVLGELPKFYAEKTRLQRSWGGTVSWADLVLAAREIFRPLVVAQLPS
jgi:hypothetical protein